VGGDYILKSGDREKLLRSVRISQALHAQGFDSSLPLLTRTGKEYFQDRETFVLTRRLRGNPLSKADRFGPSRVIFGEQYGRSIARLHKALKAIQEDIPSAEVDLYKRVTEWALPSVKRQNTERNIGLDETFFSDVMRGFGELHDKLPRQLIHRDPNPSNILFHNDTVTGFIDFDLSETNIRLWDVCYCATGILSESTDGEDEGHEKWLEILGGILRGYDLEGRLTPEEKHAVFYVICSILIICIAYFEGREMHKDLAEANRRMLGFVVRKKEQIDSLVSSRMI